MNRRSLLLGMSSSGLLLNTGCLGNENDDAEGGQVEPLTLSIANVDEVGDPLTFDIELHNDILSHEQFPMMTFTLENTGDRTVGWDGALRGSWKDQPFRKAPWSEDEKLVITQESLISKHDIDDYDGCYSSTFTDRTMLDARTELEAGERFESKLGLLDNDAQLENECP